jgi:hypothetical protein
MKKLILIFALSLLPIIATADYAIRGEGNFVCPDYVAARQTNSAKLYRPEDSDSFIGQDLTAASVVTWIENYCRANPQDYLADAAEALVAELKTKD